MMSSSPFTTKNRLIIELAHLHNSQKSFLPDIYDNLPLLRFMLCLLLLSSGAGRYICFRPILFPPLIIVKGFVRVINLSNKSGQKPVSCAVGLFLKEPSLSFIHGTEADTN